MSEATVTTEELVEMAQGRSPMPASRYRYDRRPPIGEQGTIDVEGISYPLMNGLFAINSEGGAHVRRPKVYDLENMLERDCQAMGLEAVLTLPILATTFRIEPGEEDNGEAELAREVFLKPHREGGMWTSIPSIVAQMCGAFARRRAFFEKVWRIRSDGKLVYDKLAFRRASTCEIVVDEKTKSYAGFVQEGFTPSGGTFDKKHFPPNKGFVYIHGTSAVNPLAGRSAFEAAYPAYVNKQKVELLRYMYLQKFGIPPILGKTESLNEDDQDAMHEKIRDIRAGSYAVLGPGEEIGTLTAAETVGGSTGGSADFREALRYIDGQMATSMLAGFIQLPTAGAGGSSGGSYALSRDQSDLFLLSCEARQREIEEVLTNDAIADLIYHNFGKNASYPRFKMTALSLEHEIKALDLYKALLSTGSAPPLPLFLANLIRDKGLAGIDINEDQVIAAEEKAKEAMQSISLPGVTPIDSAPSAGGAGNAAGALGRAVSSLLGEREGHSPEDAIQEMVEGFANEIYEFIYNPTKQGRDPYGRFGGGSGAGKSKNSGQTRPGGRGSVGGGSKRTIDPQPKGGRPPRPARSPGVAPPPKDKPGSQGVVALPSGEQVDLGGKPLPGVHYLLAGPRGQSPYVTFFGVEGRDLTPQEVVMVATEAQKLLDTGAASYLGKFDADTGQLSLSTVAGGDQTMLDAITSAYGSAMTALVVDGKPQGQPQGQQPGQPAQPAAQPTAPAAPATKK